MSSKKDIWDAISNEWYGVNYRELPDDGAKQEAVVSEAERRQTKEVCRCSGADYHLPICGGTC